jgi:hypothetical protein
MPKKIKESVSESENDSMQSDDYDEEVSSVEQTPAKGLREVNRANILNYESDSSEVEDGEDSAEMMPKISKSQQKN